MKKKVGILAIICILALVFTGCGQKKEAEKANGNAEKNGAVEETNNGKKEASADDFHITLKLSHVFAPDEQLTLSTNAAAEAIRERTNGAVDIQTYPQGQLPTYKDGLEQVYNGADFISVEDPSYLGDYVPDFKAFIGPYIYSDIDQYTKMCETDLVKGLVEEIERDHGIKVLALDYVFGFRNMMTNVEINKPEDLKGMKIRVPGSQIFIDTINAMGATATPMAFGETLSAVQQGVVDGLEGTVDAMTANGSAEVVKNVGLTKHFLGTCGIYINAEVFNKIPKEYQDIIQEEFTKNAKDMTNKVKTNYDSQVKELEAKGIVFNDVDYEAFQKTSEAVYDKMEGISPDIHQKLLDEIQKMK